MRHARLSGSGKRGEKTLMPRRVKSSAAPLHMARAWSYTGPRVKSFSAIPLSFAVARQHCPGKTASGAATRSPPRNQQERFVSCQAGNPGQTAWGWAITKKAQVTNPRSSAQEAPAREISREALPTTQAFTLCRRVLPRFIRVLRTLSLSCRDARSRSLHAVSQVLRPVPRVIPVMDGRAGRAGWRCRRAGPEVACTPGPGSCPIRPC